MESLFFPGLSRGDHGVCIELPHERRPEVGEDEEGVGLGGHRAVLIHHILTSQSCMTSYIQGDPSPRGLGWVDLDLGCSTVLLGQHRSCSTAQRPVEHPKSESTQPRS